MNAYGYTKGDRYNRNALPRHSPQFSASPLGSPYQRNLLNGNRYVQSEAMESFGMNEQEYYPQPAYDTYAYPERLPLDEPAEEMKQYALHQNRRLTNRTPGYVTSLDTTPSHPLPHSSLTSADSSQALYDHYDGYNRYPADTLMPLPQQTYMQNMPYDEVYGAASDWSSDSDTSLRTGRHGRHRHGQRAYPGQRRMTDLGPEVFNGMSWVAEEDYITDANTAYNQFYPSRY